MGIFVFKTLNYIKFTFKDNIIKVTKDIYYPKRNYPYIFANIEMESDKKAKLMEFINKTDDIKYLDAIEVLEYIKTLI